MLGEESHDETARSVLANVAAMEKAIAVADQRGPLKPADVNAIHRALMHGLGDAGEIRTQQNWIGGNAFNPHDAAFGPPPPELVPELMKDLCTFLGGGISGESDEMRGASRFTRTSSG